MKSLKKTLLRVFFGIEIIVFCFVYLCGTQSLKVRAQLVRENGELQKEINALEGEVMVLQQETVAWQADDFYKEKIARERLGMAKKGDIIYYQSLVKNT